MNTSAVIVPQSVTLRPACRDDAAAMRELAEAAYQPYVARIGRRPAPMTADYASIAGSGNAWVAEQRGRLVGLLVLEPAEDHLLLDNVAVDPDGGQSATAAGRGASRGTGFERGASTPTRP